MRPRASFHSKAALLFWNGKENAMNYIPKRVFLLECGKYIELSYEEFCEKKEETEGFDAKNRRYILVQGMLLEVDEPAYREHYRICRRMRYLMEMEQKVQILSFEDCIETSSSRISPFMRRRRNSRGGTASRRPPSASACRGFCRKCERSWRAYKRRKIAAWGL